MSTVFFHIFFPSIKSKFMTHLRSTIATLIFGFSIWAPTLASANSKTIGAGIVLGSPTGITGKYLLNRTTSIDATLAWSLRGTTGLFAQGSYLWARKSFLIIDGIHFDLYYGGGGFLASLKDFTLGLRAPVGLATTFTGPSLEIFGELVPSFEVIPQTSFFLGVNIGARYYF